MNAFEYKNGELFAEDVPVTAIAEEHGTPLYVYSRNFLKTQYQALADAMSEVDPLICYSVKACSNAAIIKTFLDEGSGLDIVSGGELYRALRAGADPKKIVYAGVGKTRDEIQYALREGILFFTVESEPEAERISECAAELGVTGRIAFRVNPDVDPQTHKYVSTGKGESKFGLDLHRAAAACEAALGLPNIELSGLHMHIGSQILNARPFAEALERVGALCGDLKQKSPHFQYLDIGGGIGIQYKPDQQPLDPTEFAAAVIPGIKDLGMKIVMEPGRNLVGNSAILVCRVQYVKESAFKNFIVTDGAMNDLIRPALYESYHHVIAVKETSEIIHGDMVGPICESGDFLATGRDLPAVKQDDLLAVKSAGAYGFSMASTYNSRPRPAEIMVEGSSVTVIRQRETLEDLVKGEIEVR